MNSKYSSSHKVGQVDGILYHRIFVNKLNRGDVESGM